MGTRAHRSRTEFDPMTSITVPTCNQIASALESAARFLAAILVAVYVAGEMTGRAVHGLSDQLASFTRQPLQTLIDLIPTVEPQPELLTVLGATLLEPEALDLEIAAYDAAQPAKPARKTVARRKPAKAPKVAVAA